VLTLICILKDREMILISTLEQMLEKELVNYLLEVSIIYLRISTQN